MQINYYMEYDAFLKIAEKALKNGCVILKKDGCAFVKSDDISIVTQDCLQYYFYLPQAGELNINSSGNIDISGFNVLIEAGYSAVISEKKIITGGRLYLQTGYYDSMGEWISHPDCLEKLYKRLAYSVRKLTVRYNATAEMLALIREEGYSLR